MCALSAFTLVGGDLFALPRPYELALGSSEVHNDSQG